MGLLQRWLWLALTPGLAWSAASNKVAEVDLIFPRNESFSPSPLTPIVFAIQNPSLLSTLKPTLYWHIESQLNITADDFISTGGLLHLSELNLTNVTDPYLLSWSIGHLVVDGDFSFAWELDLFNCSHNSKTDTIDEYYFGGRHSRRKFYFSTKNGTSSPDLVAFNEKETCDRIFAQAVHVPSALELPPTRTAEWGGPSCAVSPDQSPTPSPCNVKMDSSAAASISASLTAAACGNPLRTGMSCPTPSSENAASMPQFPVTRAWVLAIGTLLAYSLA